MRVHNNKPSLIERWLEPYWKRFMFRHEQAQRWTNKRCPNPACNSPIAFDGAAYCAFCGVSLTPPQLPASVELQPTFAPQAIIPARPQEPAPVTDAMYNLHQRPLQNFVQARRNGAGIRTAMTVAIDVEKLRKQRGGFKP